MITLIFATNNAHKLEEIRAAIGSRVTVIGLKEAGIERNIAEPFDTLEENASEKSGVIAGITGLDCFSEDTGLEVNALNGEPGVRSARYAGEESTSDQNIEKLLLNREATDRREARFRTVISLRWQNREYQFQGVCEGEIARERTGTSGFGYDAVFIPSGTKRTFAQMSLEEKNRCSHRKKAANKLVLFLQQHMNTSANA